MNSSDDDDSSVEIEMTENPMIGESSDLQLIGIPLWKSFEEREYGSEDDGSEGSEEEEDPPNELLLKEVIMEHDKGVLSLAFSPDFSKIYSGGDDKAVTIFDSITGSIIAKVENIHDDQVTKIVPSPDGSFIATCDYKDVAVKISHPDTMELIQTLSDHEDFVNCIGIRWDSKIIASGGADETVLIYDQVDGKWKITTVLEDHIDCINAISFGNGGGDNASYLATGSEDFFINVYDSSKNFSLLHSLSGHTDGVLCLCFSPDNSLLASGGTDGTINVWSMKDGKITRSVNDAHDGNYVLNLRWSPNSGIIASTGSGDSNIKFWNSKKNLNPMIVFDKLHSKGVSDIFFDDTSNFLLSASDDKTVKITSVKALYSEAWEKLADGLEGDEDLDLVDEAIELFLGDHANALLDAIVMLSRGDQSAMFTTLLRAVWRLARFSHFSIVDVDNFNIFTYEDDVKRYKELRSAVNKMRRMKIVIDVNEGQEEDKDEEEKEEDNGEERKHKIVCKLVYKFMLADPIWRKSSSAAHALGPLKNEVELGDCMLLDNDDGFVEAQVKVTKINDDGSFNFLDNDDGHEFENVGIEQLTFLERDPLKDEEKILNKSGAIESIQAFQNIFDTQAFPRSEDIFAAFRANSTKVIEETIFSFANNGYDLDLMSWFCFLRSRYPATYVGDFTLLLTCCWNLVTEAYTQKTRENHENDTFTALSDSVNRFCVDMNRHRDLLPVLMRDSKKKELQKLASTGVFRAALEEISARLRVMTTYKIEVAIFCLHMTTFSYTTFHFKFASHQNEIYNDAWLMSVAVINSILALSFLLREHYQYTAVKSRGLTQNYTADFWNVIDSLSSISVLAVTLYFFIAGPGWVYNYLASVSGICMWLKFLGLIKAISPQIATFVLMLTTIFRDMRSFMAVLGFVMLGFGQAIFMLIAGNDNGAYDCEYDDEVVCGIGEYETIENESKFATVTSTLQTLYMMMLGDFNPEHFNGDYLPLALGFLFMFIVVIIMLNVLIAIVSDSYDAAMSKSDELFWRAKFELITEVSTTFENLYIWIEPKQLAVIRAASKALAFFDSAHDSILFLLNFLFGAGSFHPNAIGKLVRLVFFPTTMIILFFSVTLITFFILPLKFLLNYVAGATSKNSKDDADGGNLVKIDFTDDNNNEWAGRVIDLSRRINERTATEGARVETVLTAKMTKVNEEVDEMRKELKDVKELMISLLGEIKKGGESAGGGGGGRRASAVGRRASALSIAKIARVEDEDLDVDDGDVDEDVDEDDEC